MLSLGISVVKMDYDTTLRKLGIAGALKPRKIMGFSVEQQFEKELWKRRLYNKYSLYVQDNQLHYFTI